MKKFARLLLTALLCLTLTVLPASAGAQEYQRIEPYGTDSGIIRGTNTYWFLRQLGDDASSGTSLALYSDSQVRMVTVAYGEYFYTTGWRPARVTAALTTPSYAAPWRTMAIMSYL